MKQNAEAIQLLRKELETDRKTAEDRFTQMMDALKGTPRDMRTQPEEDGNHGGRLGAAGSQHQPDTPVAATTQADHVTHPPDRQGTHRSPGGHPHLSPTAGDSTAYRRGRRDRSPRRPTHKPHRSRDHDRSRSRSRSRSGSRSMRSRRTSIGSTAASYRHPNHPERRRSPQRTASPIRSAQDIAYRIAKALSEGDLPVESGMSMPHKNVFRTDKQTKVSRGECTMAEYWYGLTCIITKETDPDIKDLILDHMLMVVRDARERPWEAVRAFSEEACARVMDPADPHITWAAKEELRAIQTRKC